MTLNNNDGRVIVTNHLHDQEVEVTTEGMDNPVTVAVATEEDDPTDTNLVRIRRVKTFTYYRRVYYLSLQHPRLTNK